MRYILGDLLPMQKDPFVKYEYVNLNSFPFS